MAGEELVEDFIRLCEIESPSRRERRVADTLAAQLRSLGLEVEEDDSGGATGSDAGNILARIPGPEGAPTVLLCAHMDTVPLTGPVEVARRDGILENRHDAILGADNKAAVAVILALARQLVDEGPPVGVEILFTTCEELALLGAKHFDQARLRSDWGYVFDHASPIGELIVAAPTYFRIEADFHGHAAHAGISPEDGRSAIAAAARGLARLDLGRVDERSTTNVGRIEGGTASNVVAERCRVELEARSIDDERAAELVREITDALTAAAADGECDVETVVEEQFRGYTLSRASEPVAVAAAALEARGIEPKYVSTGGGSDANVFIARGLPVLNVANGTERNHQPDESVTVDALHTMYDVALEMLRRAA